jgi:hypothetical protein
MVVKLTVVKPDNIYCPNAFVFAIHSFQLDACYSEENPTYMSALKAAKIIRRLTYIIAWASFCELIHGIFGDNIKSFFLGMTGLQLDGNNLPRRKFVAQSIFSTEFESCAISTNPF